MASMSASRPTKEVSRARRLPGRRGARRVPAGRGAVAGAGRRRSGAAAPLRAAAVRRRPVPVPAVSPSGGQQLRVQRPQFGARVRAEAVGEVRVRTASYAASASAGTAGVAQGAQAQGLERLVERVVVAERGQFGQDLLGAAEREGRGEPGAAGVEAAGLPAGGSARAVRQVGEGRAAPQRERVVEDGRRPSPGRRRPAPARPPPRAGRSGAGRCRRRSAAQPVAALGGGDRVVRRAPAAAGRPAPAARRPRRRAARRPTPRRRARAAGTVRPGRSASTVSRARSRAPPTATGVPSSRSAWVVPRMR